MAQAVTVINQQSMQVGVTGPNGANTLIITSGIAQCSLQAFNQSVGGAPVAQQGSFTALIDPKLTSGQFRRALATGSLSSVNYNAQDPAQRVSVTWTVSSVEADFNDESGQVELRFDVSVSTGGLNSFANLVQVAFQVTTLAAL